MQNSPMTFRYFAPLALLAAAPSGPPSDISMFPAAAPSMKQVVIRPGRLANENQLRIEFYAGQTRTIDCNMVSLAAGLTRRDLSGWGYPYWEMPVPSPAVSTRMGCPRKSERKAFVHGTPETVPYRSALPIVVYVPVGYSVRYMLWRTDGVEKEAR